MSGPGDDRSHARWRGGRPFDQNRQRHSMHRTMSAHGNPRGGQAQNPSNNWGESRDQSGTGPAQDQHVPVRGFNAAEAKAALKKDPREPKPFFYKPNGKDVNRSGGPWGSKPNNMASGKDFFLELRKQVTSLRQGANVAGG
ncbi:hypothetical protein BDV25DRAFT_159704 [Aspergillus avenaceus]|uniref:Uncharacterized protein n=1 Tax=Aspergillus avenaceus TaxID=36643 RepID=A0A5N6TN46_ASPAV|nr:hypothetical protein BDV25DRAFT_159704 [Aspergillus avenaceus]